MPCRRLSAPRRLALRSARRARRQRRAQRPRLPALLPLWERRDLRELATRPIRAPRPAPVCSPGFTDGANPWSVRRVLHAFLVRPVATTRALAGATRMDEASVGAAIELGRLHGLIGSCGLSEAHLTLWAPMERGERLLVGLLEAA